MNLLTCNQLFQYVLDVGLHRLHEKKTLIKYIIS